MPVRIFHTSNVFETRFSKWCSVTSTLLLNEMFDLAKYFQLSTPYIWASTDSTKRPTPIFLLSHSSNQDWVMKFSEIERMSKINTRMGGKKQWSTITTVAHFKILWGHLFQSLKFLQPLWSFPIMGSSNLLVMTHWITTKKILTRKSIKYLV